MTTRSAMSTVSSPGRRPFGKPARSPPATPKLLCMAAGVAAMPVLSRVISDGVTARHLVHARETREERGHEVVARQIRRREVRDVRARASGSPAPRNSASSNAGSVGFVTYVPNWPSKLRLAGAEAILVGQADHELVDERHAETRDLDPRAAVHFRTSRRSAAGFSRRAWRRLALVQPPMTPLPVPVRQLLCTSSASVVTFASSTWLFARVLRDAAREPPPSPAPGAESPSTGTKFTRSNTRPEVDREAFLALARRTRGPACCSPERSPCR